MHNMTVFLFWLGAVVFLLVALAVLTTALEHLVRKVRLLYLETWAALAFIWWRRRHGPHAYKALAASITNEKGWKTKPDYIMTRRLYTCLGRQLEEMDASKGRNLDVTG